MIERFERFSFALAEITRCWRKLASEELAKYGLKSPHARYLITMYKYPDGIAVPEICELCGKDKSDASRMLGILEKKDLAHKKVVDGSLYRGLWVLTEKGRIAAEQVTLRAMHAVTLAEKGINFETITSFYDTLDVLTKNIISLSKNGIPD